MVVLRSEPPEQTNCCWFDDEDCLVESEFNAICLDPVIP